MTNLKERCIMYNGDEYTDLKKVDMWLGDGIKTVYDSELLVKEKLRG